MSSVTHYFPTVESLAYPNNVIALLRDVRGSLDGVINQKVAPLGLTAMQWRPLVYIKYADIDTAVEIARRENTDTGAVTRILDRLQNKGFLSRHQCAHDRRVFRLLLTEKGHTVCEAILPIVADALNLHLRDFSTNEVELLKQFLQRMIVNGSAF